jgi:hypothetical protein
MSRSSYDDLFLAAYDGLFQRELLLDAKVATPARALPPAPLGAPPRKKLREKVLELGKDVAHAGAGEVEPARFEPGVPELVVPGPLLSVGKDTEGFGGLFELGGGRGVVLVAVGVELEGALPIALPNLVFGSLPAHPQNFVVAALFAHKFKNLGRPRLPSGYRTVRKVRRPIGLSTLLG